jgi:hypothetical protein
MAHAQKPDYVFLRNGRLHLNRQGASVHSTTGSLVLPSYRGDSRAVFVVGPAQPRTQHDCHHDTKVKPEAATAVIELLMMDGKTLETTLSCKQTSG